MENQSIEKTQNPNLGNKKFSKKKILITFLLCLAIAPVPLYVCFEACSVEGFAPFISAPISLLGLGTMFHWLPWMFAIIFAVIATFLSIMINKLFKNPRLGKVLSVIVVLIIFFSVSFVLNNKFNSDKSKKFNRSIYALMSGEPIKYYPDFLGYSKPGIHIVSKDDFFSDSYHDIGDIGPINLSFVQTDEWIFNILTEIKTYSNSSGKEKCFLIGDNFNPGEWDLKYLSMTCLSQNTPDFVFSMSTLFGNKYFCMDNKHLNTTEDPNINRHIVYTIDSRPVGLSCI